MHAWAVQSPMKTRSQVDAPLPCRPLVCLFHGNPITNHKGLDLNFALSSSCTVVLLHIFSGHLPHLATSHLPWLALSLPNIIPTKRRGFFPSDVRGAGQCPCPINQLAYLPHADIHSCALKVAGYFISISYPKWRKADTNDAVDGAERTYSVPELAESLLWR